jgi:hypothetical protein
MIPNLLSGDSLFEVFDRTQPAGRPPLSWRVLVPVVLVGNVALAIIAWFAVELAMKLF